MSSDTFKGISGPDSNEKLAPNIIDKYSPALNRAKGGQIEERGIVSQRQIGLQREASGDRKVFRIQEQQQINITAPRNKATFESRAVED